MECVTIIPNSFKLAAKALGERNLNETLFKRTKNPPYYVRLKCKDDIDQVTEIDREAFPTQWPAPNYQHELRNQLAHYIVACDEEKTVDR